MGFHRAVLWVAVGGVIALVAVSYAIEQPALRLILSLLAITPLIYVTTRVAVFSERRVTQQRRRFLKLRNITDEFILAVRNLNRLSVISKTDQEAPEDTPKMIEEIVERMHGLVERMRDAAGEQQEEEEEEQE